MAKITAKSKPKTAPKKKPAAKATAKPKKVKAKSKPKAQAKAKPKSKPHVKTKAKAKAKTNTKSKAAGKNHLNLNDAQKEQLLEAIQKIVDLRKHREYGLKSLDKIDQILNPYNQKYVDSHSKFDAIVDFGVDQHARYTSDAGMVALKDTGKDSSALHALLNRIGNSKVNFSEAHKELNEIYEESQSET